MVSFALHQTVVHLFVRNIITLFADPADGDFTLKPGSSAFKIGFKPINGRHFGSRKRAAGSAIIHASPVFVTVK